MAPCAFDATRNKDETDEGTWDARFNLPEFGDELQHLFRPFMTTLVKLKLNREPMPPSVAMKTPICRFEGEEGGRQQ